MLNNKKTANITFHGAHNYGSALQAYALQKHIQSLGYENEIIDFRTDMQTDMYSVFTKRKGLKYLLKNATHLLFYKSLKKKHERFEKFISEKLSLSSKTYKTTEELEKANFDYDYYIAGSDQIWNPIPSDFSLAYFLPFVKSGKRIAYAPSFGQFVTEGEKNTPPEMASYLKKFDYISVREKNAQKNVEKLIGVKPEIVLDPTLLLDKTEWNKLVNKDYAPKGDYIFLYTLFANKEVIEIAKKVSEELNMPVVTSNFSNQFDAVSPFTKMYDAGPQEFLALVKNAKLVLATSFHGTVFSVLFHTPFYAINGNNDTRIANLLSVADLSDRTISTETVDEKIKTVNSVDFSKADVNIGEMRKYSSDFLKKALSEE